MLKDLCAIHPKTKNPIFIVDGWFKAAISPIRLKGAKNV